MWMTDDADGATSAGHELSRRDLLRVGAGAAATGLLGSSPLAWARGAATPWPGKRLPASAAHQVAASQFISARQLELLGRQLDRVGLRACASAPHEGYVRSLVGLFRRAGVRQVHLEPVAMKRWLASSWSLSVAGKTMPYVYYVPYSQQTGPAGLTAELVYVPIGELLNGSASDIQSALAAANVKGKIAVFDVPYTAVPAGTFAGLSYQGALYDPQNRFSGTYTRPWFNQIASVLSFLTDAGAVGTIGIWTDLPGKWARQYTPYDAVFRPIPGLWIDRDGGAKLKQLAGNGAKATIKLRAAVKDVNTHNLIGFIPGKSKELTVLHTHTDGTNGMEENGMIPILATAQYLARLPLKSRERTIMVMLSAGHFAGGVGIRGFLDRHQHDLVPRITSLLTMEHVGCTEWLPASDGAIRSTGKPELGVYFAPGSKGLVDASIASEPRNGIACTVDRPFVPSPAGAKEPTYWPGEGTYFWMLGGLLDSNYITGPYGLITADLNTTGMVDYKLMRHEAMTAVLTTLQLAATSNADLQASAN